MITSLTNPRVKQAVRLRERSSERRESGLFLIESRRELDRALAAGFRVVEVYVCPALVRGDVPRDSLKVSEAVLKKLAVRENPEGIVAVLESKTASWNDLPDAERDLFVLCSGLEKPGNVGAILRSADAAGATAVLLDNPEFDLFNPHCIRASTGAVFSTPVVCDSREKMLGELRRRGVKIVAATPEAKSAFTQANLSQPVALVMGAEAEGLDAFWRDAADLTVCIPQRGSVDSLNVSVTAAILLFEAARQRS